jgi:hypothetical protein
MFGMNTLPLGGTLSGSPEGVCRFDARNCQTLGVPRQSRGFTSNSIDLRGGRKAEDFQPVGVKVEQTPGIGPPEQRVAEQDADGILAEVLFPNMAAGPRLWCIMQDDDAYNAAIWTYNKWLAEEYCPVAPD